MPKEDLNFNKRDLKNIYEEKVFTPKNDVVFQALFSRGKESVTKAFLEDILKIKINKIDLDKAKELLNNNINAKNGRLDIRAVLNDNVECDIEMQVCSHKNLLERFLYYWSKIYVSNLEIGDDYIKLRKTISIIIIDEEIPEFKQILKSHTKWQIREEENLQIVLTPYLQIDIIELPKALKEYQKNSSNEMLQWMVFLDNPENKEVVKIMEENENIKTANEELKKLSMDRELYLAAVRAKLYRMDIEQAKKEAVEEARQAAKEEGEKIGKLKDAKRMLEENIPIETVIRITGLTKEEIENGLQEQ